MKYGTLFLILVLAGMLCVTALQLNAYKGIAAKQQDLIDDQKVLIDELKELKELQWKAIEGRGEIIRQLIAAHEEAR